MVAGVVAQVPQNGLQAYYSFDNGSLADESPYMRGTLTAFGAPTTAIPCFDNKGVLDAARDFFPTVGGIQTPAGALYKLHSGMPSGNSSRSVCFWINRSDGGDSTAGVVLWGKRPSWNFGVYMHKTNSQSYLTVRGFSQPCSVRVSVNGEQTYMAIGSWHFVTVTYSAGDLRISVDNGSQTSFAVGSTNTDTTGDTLNIGAYRYSVGSVRAKLDEVCIYNRALTTNEIAQIYQPVSVRASVRHNAPIIRAVQSAKNYDLLGRNVPDLQRSLSCGVYAGRIVVK